MKLDNQGRTNPPDAYVTAAWLRDPATVDIALRLLGAVAIGLVLGFALCGCAQPVRVYSIGDTIVHENDLSACKERGAVGCSVGRNVYVMAGDSQTLTHELQHAQGGMRHSEWFVRGYNNCARITQAGNTQWREGRLICRNERGEFFERGN